MDTTQLFDALDRLKSELRIIQDKAAFLRSKGQQGRPLDRAEALALKTLSMQCRQLDETVGLLVASLPDPGPSPDRTPIDYQNL